MLLRLPEEPSSLHARARLFCLETIDEFDGFKYRQDWHADLDTLSFPAASNHYSRQHGGGFWTLCDAHGGLVATAGVRHLGWRPNIAGLFPGRYARVEKVASLWRVYVRKDRRGQGIGRWMTLLGEAEAVGLGYGTMYLHANSDAAGTLAFWEIAGYRRFGTCETSTHFDKRLKRSALL